MSPLVSVVIPVYNERPTIEEILRRVQAVDIDKEVLVIDDGSTDGTRELLIEIAQHSTANRGTVIHPVSRRGLGMDDMRVFFQEKNCGKGAALRRGFQEARGRIVVIQDADLEYDPQNFHALIEPIEHGQADVVYGSRFIGGPHRVLFFWHYVGNKILTTLSDMFTDLNLSDVWTCYKAFRREVLEQIDLKENRFGFEQEVTCKIAQNGWRVYEVPISYYGRTYSEGKKITWKDGFRGLWCLLRYGSRSKRPSHAAEAEAPMNPRIARISKITEREGRS
jgi:glycosyltransferase involved in cell wall biosynthesis